MEANKEKQKQEALLRMKMLNLMPNVIEDFKKKNKVYYSERQSAILNAVLYWIDNDEKYTKLIKDFEEKHKCLVYHCQLTHLRDIGDCLSLLYVSESEEEWQYDRQDLKEGYPLVYVYNLDFPYQSEFGSIGVQPSMGGIVRTA